jgi:hypothetical protein
MVVTHELQNIIGVLCLYQSVASILLGLTFAAFFLSVLFPFDSLMKQI